MTNSYKWSIQPSGVASMTIGNTTLDKVYTNLYYTLIGSDGNNNYTSVGGKTDLGPPSVNNFISIENVTANIILEWLQEAIGNSYIDTMKSQVDSQLVELQNPPVFTGNNVVIEI